MDWQNLLLFLSALILVLLFVAGLVYLIFNCRSSPPDDDDDDNNQLRARRAPKAAGEKAKQRQQQGRSSQQAAAPLLATDGQTMVSSLRHSPKDSDVVLVTASSAIPLAELGGKNTDIIVDVMQQLNLDEKELAKESRQCIVCDRRNEISWKQVSCYAQTTIGVLVLKRDLVEQRQRQAAPQDENPPESKRKYSINQTPGAGSSRAIKSQTASTFDLLPSPDPRIDRQAVNPQAATAADAEANQCLAQRPQATATTTNQRGPTKSRPQNRPENNAPSQGTSSSRRK